MSLLFWILLFVILYSFVGYGLLIVILVQIKRVFAHLFCKKKKDNLSDVIYREVTILIPAFNEKDYIEEKIRNTEMIEYPSDKLHQLWVLDGSDDGSEKLLKNREGIVVLHDAERRGKSCAINHGMQHVKTDIVILSDANTMLSKQCVSEIVRKFEDPKVGCVSGEKRIVMSDFKASSQGESIYWKAESILKKYDAELKSAVGAAGELCAIRKSLFSELEPDTILDDFIMSIRIVCKGYKIEYSAEAFSEEHASLNIREEIKRKIRIAAGGLQSVPRLLPILNPFKFGIFTLQYVSHKLLRWLIAPWALITFLVINLYIVNVNPGCSFYLYFLYAQILFYSVAVAGFVLDICNVRFKLFFVPYYFCVMNGCVIAGHFKYVMGKQDAVWKKAERGK